METQELKLIFRGVRGSIPTPLDSPDIEQKLLDSLSLLTPEDTLTEGSRKEFVKKLPLHLKGCYGGNSSCVEVIAGGENFIFDCGSGLRNLGLDWMKKEFGRGQGDANIFLSHTHWDHIMGIPFFVPFYVEGNQFRVYGAHKNLKERLVIQQGKDFFPVTFDSFAADIDVIEIHSEKEVLIGDVKVTWKEMYHPGKSFAYCLEYAGKKIIYATDAEYRKLSEERLRPIIDFFDSADILIFDAQYTFVEGLEKEDWGHSSTFLGVDLALKSGVKEIVFYHHEPTYSDRKLLEIFNETECYLKAISPDSNLKMSLAYEGKTFNLIPQEQLTSPR